FDITLYDLKAEALTKAINGISGSCDRLIKKETLTQDQKANILKKIKTTTAFEDLKNCEMAIEAVTEHEPLKLDIFRKLDQTLGANAIIASNTSSISITKIGGATKRPDKVVGMHFMNPVPLMKLVEGIRGLATSDVAFSATKEVAEKMGKTFIEVRDF